MDTIGADQMITWLTRPLQIAALIAALVGAWELNNWKQRNVGASQLAEKTNTEAEKISEKAVENRALGDVPDAVAKLRKRACRDC
jgi:hypothetical protein